MEEISPTQIIYPTRHVHKCEHENCKNTTKYRLCTLHNRGPCTYIKRDKTICGRSCMYPKVRCSRHTDMTMANRNNAPSKIKKRIKIKEEYIKKLNGELDQLKKMADQNTDIEN